MKRYLHLIIWLAFALALCGCGAGSAGEEVSESSEAASESSARTLEASLVEPLPKRPIEPAFREMTVWYSSRGVKVPAIVAVPEGAERMPFVILCHGHGGEKNQYKGLSSIAAALAKEGIGSIRMDFPGCGDSTEDFAENTVANMKEDALAAVRFVEEEYDADPARIGIFGYSMGGRVALELLKDKAYPFAAVGLLAPAADATDLEKLFGGEENWERLKAEAEEHSYAVITTTYGKEQHMSLQWFEDVERYPDGELAAEAAEAYDGPALVIYASDDQAIRPSVSLDTADKLGAEVVEASGDGHTYGFFSDKRDVLEKVVTAAAGFFKKNLEQHASE